MDPQTESRLFDREWFYPFDLPDGRSTPSYNGGHLDEIHATRSEMMLRTLSERFGNDLTGKRAIDIACHQGFFSSLLADRGANVLGVDARTSHIDDYNLITKAREQSDLMRAEQHDVHQLDQANLGRFDIVLMLGLIYHLENPIGAIRQAYELTDDICLIETQVVPHLTGSVDWGNYTFVKELKGCFGIIDETDETHGPEASTLGICLAPSAAGLLWIMDKVGFKRPAIVTPSDDAYEQLKFGKRVMAVGYRD